MGLPFTRRDGFQPHHVGRIKPESLADADRPVGKLERQLAGGVEVAGGGSDVERRVDLVTQCLVVGVEPQRKPKAGRRWIHQIERLALFVLIFLQDP